jgi:hypothetical protein
MVYAYLNQMSPSAPSVPVGAAVDAKTFLRAPVVTVVGETTFVAGPTTRLVVEDIVSSFSGNSLRVMLLFDSQTREK